MGTEHKDGEEPAGLGNGPVSATGTAWSEDWDRVTRYPVRMVWFLAHATSALSPPLPVVLLGFLPVQPCAESLGWILRIATGQEIPSRAAEEVTGRGKTS